MATIREEYVLVDQFSSTFGAYINMAERASSANEKMADTAENGMSVSKDAIEEYIKMAESLERQIIKLTAEQEAQANAMESLDSRDIEAMGNRLEKTANKLFMVTAEYEGLKQAMRDSGVAQILEEAAMAATETANRINEMAESAEEMNRLAEAEAQMEAEMAEASKTTEEQYDEMSRLQKTMEQMSNSADNVGNVISRQFRRMTMTLFSVRRILSFLRNSLEDLPDSATSGWTKATGALSNFTKGGIGAVLQGMQSSLEKFNAALNSSSGQKFARGFETVMRAAGSAVGFLADRAADLIEFAGDNFQTVMTVAAVVAALFAAKMLMAAGATVAANLPLILFVGLIAAVVTGLMAAGVTSEQIFSAIGGGAGWLYAFVYNLVAETYNVFAAFAEFFANVFNDPVTAVANLFYDVFDAILGVVESTAGAIDALLGTNLEAAVSGFRSKLQGWADEALGENKIQIERMEHINYADTMSNFAQKGAGLSDLLSDFSLEKAIAVPLSNISSDTGSIKKAVNQTDEDIKSLVDLATRQYVNKINLTAQSPVINVQGQNTGNTAADRKALADAMRDIILEQSAAASVRSTAMPA